MSVQKGSILVLTLVALAGCRDDAVAPERPLVPQPTQSVAAGTDVRRTQLVPTPRSALEVPAAAAITSASPPSALSSIVAVGSGLNFSCALRGDGLAFCWGANYNGSLGYGSSVGSRYAVEVSGPVRFQRLFVGDANACGLDAANAAYCWGDNTNGQLGIGSTSTGALVPVAVSGGHAFTALSIGLRSICGIATDGVTYCWGNNTRGQLGNGSVGGSVTTPQPVVNSAAIGFVHVSAGFFNSCALTGSGEVYCWGAAGPGYGNGASAPASYVPVASASGMRFTSLDVGSVRYACGIDANADAYCWGDQPSGEAGNGSFATPVLSPTAVTRIPNHATIDAHHLNSFLATTCTLRPSGAVFCFGSNERGQLGTTSSDSCTFGALVYDCSATPLRVSGGRRYAGLAVGGRHVCAVESGSGEVYCWGDNSDGQLGDGSVTQSTLPVQVARLVAPPQDGYIVVTPPTTTLFLPGATQQYTAVSLDENGVARSPQPQIRWFSSDPAVATVSSTGLVTVLTSGSATITARNRLDQFGYANVTANIPDPLVAFRSAWSGTSANSPVTSDGLAVIGGLLTDEWTHSGTFPTRREVDQRAISTTNSQMDQAYRSLNMARSLLELEAARLQGVSPADPAIGQMLALAGYTYLGFAEAYCSGVPLLDPDVGLTTAELFTIAESRFSQSLAGPVAAPHDMLARVGRARARLGMGNYAGAAADAALVPVSFRFDINHNAIPGEENWTFSLNTAQRRLSLADAEGTNGLPFRSAGDPRSPWVFAGIGFNGQSPQYNLTKYTSTSDDLVLASGFETQLMQAETTLNTNPGSAFLVYLNALRAIGSLPPLADPGTTASRVDLVFSERAYWLLATGTRLGDVRRLIGQYGRGAATVLPVGAYPIGGSYGTDANLPVPASARGSSFTGCVDRTS